MDNDAHIRGLVSQFDESAHSDTPTGRANMASLAFEQLCQLVANVGRLADAAERIAENTAPTVVNNVVEPKRDFIGQPPETKG